jgi:hypothetical protein
MKQERLKREKKTIEFMIEIYCKGIHHQADALCDECRELLAFAMKRIEKCPYHENKPTCAKCPIHYYKPEMRTLIRRVMRYTGPRMMLYHPLLAILHLIDGITKSSNKYKELIK